MRRCLNCMEEFEEQESACPNCGWNECQNPGPWMEPGAILAGRYIIGTVRKSGAADIHYIGWDALFNRRVLVMEYFPESCAQRKPDGGIEQKREEIPQEAGEESQESQTDPFADGKARFRECGERLICLDGARGLLNVLAVVEDNGTVYQILEYPGEQTLRQVLEQTAPLELPRVEALVDEISAPIMAAHRREVYHGCLDAQNCFVLGNGEILVGCFDDSGYVTGDVADPSAGPLGPDTDIFELAHMMGTALCGTEAWESRSADENLDVLKKKVPDYMYQALRRALSEDPEDWQGSMRRFVDEFTDQATIEIKPKSQKRPGAESLQTESARRKKWFH